MIKIEVNTEDNEKVNCHCAVEIEATTREAIAEFKTVLVGLNRANKLVLALALHEFLEEYFD